MKHYAYRQYDFTIIPIISDHRRYAVFCLVRIGSTIFDSKLIEDVDRTKTDICFEDVILL